MCDKAKVKELLAAKDAIRSFLYEREEELTAIRKATTIPSEWIVEFADNIVLTLHAPPHWREGMPLINCHAPAPQLDEMNMGKANAISLDATKTVDITDDASNEMKTEENISNEAKVIQPMKRPVELQKESTSTVKKVKVEPKAVKNISLSFGLSDSDDD